MPYIEPEVILEVKQMDLLTYLQNYEPQELVHVSGNVYCTKAHGGTCQEKRTPNNVVKHGNQAPSA